MPVPWISIAQANGTSPWTVITPGWAPEPAAGRGTMDIVWTCLVTIFACSWTVTHTSFPDTSSFPLGSKIRSCMTAVLAPEYLVTLAYLEYIAVRDHTKAINQLSNGPCTIAQAFYAYMGGVQLEFRDCTEALGRQVSGDFDAEKALRDLRRAVQLNILGLDAISMEDIKSRAKTTHIVKALVCIQASWLIAQVIGRAIAKLPITTLEVVTAGYVLYALTTYSFWWHKPQDAEVFITVNCRSLTKREFYQKINDVHTQHKLFSGKQLPIRLILAGAFGATHCTAWNFVFATFTESVMWKVASVLAAFLPMMHLMFAAYSRLLPSWPFIKDETAHMAVVPLYTIVRLYLMVEPFIAFRSVPIGIFYAVSWASWIPHI